MAMSVLNISLIKEVLYTHGTEVGAYMPWHTSTNPYNWLIAEFLLKLTTRRIVSEIYESFINEVPTFFVLYTKSTEDIINLISRAGLQNQRANDLKRIARRVIEEFNGVLPSNKEGLISLPGVGYYITDTLLLHLFGCKLFPIDSNIQRLMRRLQGFQLLGKTRRNEPYKDEVTTHICQQITNISQCEQMKSIHLGSLDLAWKYCVCSPKCDLCPLSNQCIGCLKLVE